MSYLRNLPIQMRSSPEWEIRGFQRQFDGWEVQLDPEDFNLLSILKFRKKKDDFTFNKKVEHAEITKFVSYVRRTATDERWKRSASLLDCGALKVTGLNLLL